MAAVAPIASCGSTTDPNTVKLAEPSPRCAMTQNSSPPGPPGASAAPTRRALRRAGAPAGVRFADRTIARCACGVWASLKPLGCRIDEAAHVPVDLKRPSGLPMICGRMRALRQICSCPARGRAPFPVLVALLALLAVAPVGLALSTATSVPKAGALLLSDIARNAGCALSEFDADPHSNPPVSGRVDERVTANDGSYVGRRPPSALASTHSLLHGRVLVQYQPQLPTVQLKALDDQIRADPDHVLLFANTTGMPQPIAATAYLNLMTCPRVDTQTLEALRAFRERRSAFQQRF
jgi:uncharacterized protein DUF3105